MLELISGSTNHLILNDQHLDPLKPTGYQVASETLKESDGLQMTLKNEDLKKHNDGIWATTVSENTLSAQISFISLIPNTRRKKTKTWEPKKIN